MKRRIAMVTGSRFPHEDDDEEALSQRLAQLGVKAVRAAWDDPSVEWGAFDLAVIRSTWDYTVDVSAFVSWARRTAVMTCLLNPTDVIEWNVDKRYLGELAASGLQTVPTQYCQPGEQWAPSDHEDYVLKPAISGGARNTGRFKRGRDDADATRLASDILSPGCPVLGVPLRRGRALMVQPYISAVDSVGEKSRIFLGGQLSHAIRKGPVLADGGNRTPLAGRGDNITPTEWSEDESHFAHRVLASVPNGGSRLAYARVDVARDAEGAVLLMELELIEPELFLYTAPGSSDRLVDVLAHWNTG